MIDRIFRNLKTTIPGLFIIVAASLSTYFMGTSWTEASVGMGVGLVLLGVKDPKKNKKQPNDGN